MTTERSGDSGGHRRTLGCERVTAPESAICTSRRAPRPSFGSATNWVDEQRHPIPPGVAVVLHGGDVVHVGARTALRLVRAAAPRNRRRGQTDLSPATGKADGRAMESADAEGDDQCMTSIDTLSTTIRSGGRYAATECLRLRQPARQNQVRTWRVAPRSARTPASSPTRALGD